MNNKKVLAISVIAVFVLVVAIIATSYATFTANLTGTKENKIQTGYVKMNCDETTINVSDTDPMNDAEGIAANNATKCTLSVTMNGTMKLGYDIGFTDVTATNSLSTSGVKFQAYKQVGSPSATKQYLAGTTATTGKVFSDIASTAGTQVTEATNGLTASDLVSTYAIDSAQVDSTQNIYYTILTWVSSEGSGSQTTTGPTNGVCSDATYPTKETCNAAGEIWGTKQTVEQAGGQFSFKLKIASTQK